jgi:hypothetical protein
MICLAGRPENCRSPIPASLHKDPTERKFSFARGMTATDFCVKSTTGIEDKRGRLVLVINGQKAPRYGFSEADAGISNVFDISMTSFG